VKPVSQIYLVFISNSTHLYLGGIILAETITSVFTDGIDEVFYFFLQDTILKMGAYAILDKQGFSLERIALQLIISTICGTLGAVTFLTYGELMNVRLFI
jgi:hypothetical protein